MPYPLIFLKALAFTISVELAIGIIIRITGKLDFSRKHLQKIAWPKFTIGIIMATTMTLPYVWFIFSMIEPRIAFIVTAELFAWLMEALFYKYFFDLKILPALLFSLALNMASFLLGLLVSL